MSTLFVETRHTSELGMISLICSNAFAPASLKLPGGRLFVKGVRRVLEEFLKDGGSSDDTGSAVKGAIVTDGILVILALRDSAFSKSIICVTSIARGTVTGNACELLRTGGAVIDGDLASTEKYIITRIISAC